MEAARLEGVPRSSASRRFVAAALAVAVIFVTLGGLASAASQSALCGLCPQHDCGTAMRQDCCPAGTPAVPAASIVAETLTAGAKADQAAVDWLSEATGTLEIVRPQAETNRPFDASSPPSSTHPDCIVALLI